MRACDICRQVKLQMAPWHFVIEGKAEPSDWRMAEHWCTDCMKAAREFLAHLAA